MQQPIRGEQEKEEAAKKENGKRDGDECDYLVYEIGVKKGGDKGSESKGGRDTERRGEEGETEGKEEGSGQTEREDGGRGDTKEEDGWIGEIKDDTLSELLFISDSSVCPSSHPSEQPAAATLHQAWGHDLGNRDDLSDGHLSDCLQAELAIVYSDSDAGEDQWAAFAPCDVTNQEEAGEGIHDIICDGENKEAKRGGEDEETGEGSGTEEQGERRGGRDDDEEQMRSRRDLFLRSPSVSSTASSTDPDRKVRLFLFNIMP